MATTRTPALPKVTLGKFEAAAELLERMARENASVFVEAQADYAAAHREATSRPLRPEEAAQVAAAMSDALGSELAEDPGAAAANIQASELRAYDEPSPREVLLAAGAATAPAFLRLAMRFVALIELPSDAFENASTEDQLDEVLDEAVARLRELDLDEARERAKAALEHFGSKAGVSGPKAWALLGQTVLGALMEATRMTGLAGSAASSLIGSAPATADGHAPTSSTASPSPS